MQFQEFFKVMLSRQKGGRGEREWKDVLNKTFHTNYARTPMSGAFEGLKGDVRKLYGSPRTIADKFHWEIKRVEKLNIHKAIAQAVRDSRPPLIPCVPFRRNNEEWLITLRAVDFLNLLVELQDLRKLTSQSKERRLDIQKKEIQRKETQRQIRRDVYEKRKKWKQSIQKKK